MRVGDRWLKGGMQAVHQRADFGSTFGLWRKHRRE
jgi:hypothetical protein